MPLHPDAQAFLDERAASGACDPEQLSVEDARAQSIRLHENDVRVQVESTREIQVPGPNGPIPVRLYYPNRGKNLPIIAFYHGGGFVLGNLDTTDGTCRSWAVGTQCIVASVNYRHAPEHKFPAAAEDAYAAALWLSEHAVDLDADAARLVVAGMSAGGGLSATTALMARDRSKPAIALQVLWVPVVDCNFESNSYTENAVGYGLTRSSMQWFWENYLKDESDARNPYASPLRAGDLSNLPPALVVLAEYDPLRDEGLAYAERLRAAGVPVEVQLREGMIHGFLGAGAEKDAVSAIRKAMSV